MPMDVLSEITRRKLAPAQAKRYYDRRAKTLFRRFIQSNERLSLPLSSAPRVSVILVLYNRAELTHLCLKSIPNTTDLPIETVIVDNASTDGTAVLLERIDGARVIRNDDNLGFVKGVNQALAVAGGAHVLLLNNDAQLFPGALAAAVSTLESASDIGAVGGRIVLPDGRLQEAGSIVWNDGSCLGYGRGAHPDEPAFLYRRDVDYCSGAFLLVRRDLFLELGGFDEAFAPAYYEETDLCLRLRARGYRVVYEPDAVVLHYEFASSASPRRALEQQETNREIFAAKHAALLARQCAPDPGNLPVARSNDRRRRRLLLIEDRVPHRAFGAGFPRSNDIVRSLVDLGYFVTVYPTCQTQMPEENLAGLYTDLPREVEIAWRPDPWQLAAFLEERPAYYDVIMVSRPHNMHSFKAVYESNRALFDGARIIYDAEAIFALRDAAKRELDGSELPVEQIDEMVSAEVELARPADNIAAVSPREALEFTKRGLAQVHVLGLQVAACPSPRPFEARQDILFVGAIHGDDTPNADSVLWFARAVWPILSKDLPGGTAFVIAGTNRSRAVWALNGGTISVRGFVEDLGPLYDACRLFVAPTRYAAGLPYKAHEAAAHGLPMVATSLIAGQLGWTDGRDLLVADTPEAMARQCLALYRDEALWRGLRDGALGRIEAECSPDAFRAALAAIVQGGVGLGPEA